MRTSGVKQIEIMKETDHPTGSPTTRTMAMPSDTNPSGDIFGGWVLSQMDIAGGICAGQRSQGRVVTAAIDGMHFYRPVKIGDVLGVYTNITNPCRYRPKTEFQFT